MVSGISNIGFRGSVARSDYNSSQQYMEEPRRRRYDDLEYDTVEISSKKRVKKEEDNDTIREVGKSITQGVKSFVDMTVQAFARGASEAVVGKLLSPTGTQSTQK